jgi:membrane protein
MTVINIVHHMSVFIQEIKKIINRLQQTAIGIAVSRFSQNESSISAAGLTFYAIFSLFPLLLVIVSVGSFILERFMTTDEISAYIFNAFPMYQDFIRSNVMSVLHKRGAIGVIGLVSLIWSASGYFNILVSSLNNAWPGIKPRGFFKRRMLAIGMILGLIILLILSFISTSVINLLSHLQIPMGGSLQMYESALWKFFNNWFPYIFTFVLFWLLYFLIPNLKVKKRAAMVGALFASLAWNLANQGITLYVSSRYFRYDIVYGSLSTIVSLLFWIYVTNIIVLFGAYLAAGVQYRYFPATIPGASNGSTVE